MGHLLFIKKFTVLIKLLCKQQLFRKRNASNNSRDAETVHAKAHAIVELFWTINSSASLSCFLVCSCGISCQNALGDVVSTYGASKYQNKQTHCLEIFFMIPIRLVKQTKSSIQHINQNKTVTVLLVPKVKLWTTFTLPWIVFIMTG